MNSRAGSLRVVLLFLFAVLAAAPASAECNAYECSRSVDTAECWIRYGPNANLFRRGSECTVGRNCGWVFNYGEWDMVCHYDCNINPCYDV